MPNSKIFNTEEEKQQKERREIPPSFVFTNSILQFFPQ